MAQRGGPHSELLLEGENPTRQIESVLVVLIWVQP